MPNALKSIRKAIFGGASAEVFVPCLGLAAVAIVVSRNAVSIRIRFSMEMTLTTLRNSLGERLARALKETWASLENSWETKHNGWVGLD